MSLLWPERIFLDVGPVGLSLRRRGGADIEVPLLADWAASLAALPALPRRARLEVVVADCHARYFRMTWPRGLKAGEREGWLRHRFASVFGSADGWSVIADRDAVVKPSLAVALPAALVDALRDFSAARRLRLASLLPSFAAHYNRGAPRFAAEGALACNQNGRLTVGVWQRGSWLAVRSQTAADAAACLTGLLPQLAGQGEAVGGGILYVNGASVPPSLPAGWRAAEVQAAGARAFRLCRAPAVLALDFAVRRRWPGWLGWLMLALGVAATGGVMHEYEVLDAQRSDEAQRVERIKRVIVRQAGRSQLDVVPPTERELRPAVGVARMLRRDWPALLASLETAADDPGVALLAVDLEGPRGALKLAGEARNLPEVFAFARRVEAGDGLADVRLANYAFHVTGSVQVVGFTLAARWEGEQ